MNKTREQWQKVDAKHCAEHNSNAANFYLIRDAQQDIERLHVEVETLRKRARTAEQGQCEECGGNGSGGDHEDDCSKAPARPAAQDQGEVIGYLHRCASTSGFAVVTSEAVPPNLPSVRWHEPEPLVTWTDYASLEADNARLERLVSHWQTLAVANRKVADNALAQLAAIQGGMVEAVEAPEPWRDRLRYEYPNADPEYWSEELIIDAQSWEIAEWREQHRRITSATAAEVKK